MFKLPRGLKEHPKVRCTCPCDTYFHNLDEDPDWVLAESVLRGEENGIGYEMCVYEKSKCAKIKENL